MAMCVLYSCGCGRGYGFYVPKRILAKEMKMTKAEVNELNAIDKKELNQLERMKNDLRHLGRVFVDLSVKDAFQCECGEVCDLLAILAKRKREMSQ